MVYQYDARTERGYGFFANTSHRSTFTDTVESNPAISYRRRPRWRARLGGADDVFFESFHWEDEDGHHTMSRAALCNAWVDLHNQHSHMAGIRARITSGGKTSVDGSTICPVEDHEAFRSQHGKINALYILIEAFLDRLHGFEQAGNIPTSWGPPAARPDAIDIQWLRRNPGHFSAARHEVLSTLGFSIARWAQAALPLQPPSWLPALRARLPDWDYDRETLEKLAELESDTEATKGQSCTVSDSSVEVVEDHPTVHLPGLSHTLESHTTVPRRRIPFTSEYAQLVCM